MNFFCLFGGARMVFKLFGHVWEQKQDFIFFKFFGHPTAPPKKMSTKMIKNFACFWAQKFFKAVKYAFFSSLVSFTSLV